MLTMSPATMPWDFRADGHGRFAGQDPGAGSEAFVKDRYRRDELQRCPDRALGIVLVRGRRAPHRHDRVADELLDHAPVAVHRLPGNVEVAGQQIPGVLRVALLRGRGEADQVDEQDGHEPALRNRLEPNRGGCRGGSGRCVCRGLSGPGKGGAALATELRARRVLGAAHGAGCGEGVSALHAELPVWLVLGGAIGAGQQGRRASIGPDVLIRTCSIGPSEGV